MAEPSNAELVTVDLLEVFNHPDNPRLGLRDDVIEQLAVQMASGGFGSEHAILVRPVDGGFQVLSGHHRVAAARQVGLNEVPAWVRRDLSDDEAFMLLVLSNTQGELAPLEIGFHALRAVPLGKGGRGQSGGLSEYATQIGRTQASVSQLRAAARVAKTHKTLIGLRDLSPMALYEISQADESVWPVLVDNLLSHGWTVDETRHHVQTVGKFDVPADHKGWLPLPDLVAAYLETGRPTPTAVDRLVSEADFVLEAISKEGTEADATEFVDWLTANREDAWQYRKINEYHADLIRKWAVRRWEADDRGVKVCRAAELDAVAGLDAGSVDLIFTDPPYPSEFVECWTELGELAVRILKPGGFLLAYSGQYTMLEAVDRLRSAGLSWFWCHAVQHDGAFFRMNATHVQCGWKPVLVFRNGDGDPPNWHKDLVSDGSREKSEHDWQQSEAEAAYWISELTRPDDLVVDPFVGGGTTAVVCQQLSRRFVGCDVDERAVESTRERLER